MSGWDCSVTGSVRGRHFAPDLQVRGALLMRSASPAPTCREMSMLTPVPMPKKMQRSTSMGWELVPTAAMAVWSQYLPMTNHKK